MYLFVSSKKSGESFFKILKMDKINVQNLNTEILCPKKISSLHKNSYGLI